MTILSAPLERLAETARDLEGALADGLREPFALVPLLLSTGRHNEAAQNVASLLAAGAQERLLAARVLFAVHDYDRLAALIHELEQDPALDDDRLRRLSFRWRFAANDLRGIESLLESTPEGVRTATDFLAAGRLAVDLRRLPEAKASYERAENVSVDDEDRAAAVHGLASVLYREQAFDATLSTLRRALVLAPLDPDALNTLAHTLIRLGRTQEAVEAAQLAVRLAPWHEGAHYLLGNGYTPITYTRLYETHPEVFASGQAVQVLQRADECSAHGDEQTAQKLYQDLVDDHPNWADVRVRLGASAFAQRNWALARQEFAAALEVCPDYGRAHNGLARTLEAQRHAHSIHLEADESSFQNEEEPEIPGLADLVVNLEKLSARHRKRVALSVRPWKRWLPVLRAAGCTFYIKPLHEKLSEAPGQHLLKDQRISYDARLWDDVRGCGGFSTVTGIEDVERTVTKGYDTVLHELTHQVHHVLPAPLRRRIQELYRRTKERAGQNNTDVFVSRYAGENVWEYFAEGANALANPRRDVYDPREIVRERLLELDSELHQLVVEIMDEVPLDDAFTSAHTTRGHDQLRHGRAGAAADAFRQALARSPGEEDALSSLAFSLQVQGDSAAARKLLDQETDRGRSATLAVALADAQWLAGEGLDTALKTLEAATSTVRPDERHRVFQRLGTLAWTLGDANRARHAFEAVLSYQQDNPAGLWGLASALALDGEMAAAKARYQEAIQRRSGLVDLRADYARVLIASSEWDAARRQLDAALGLDAEDPESLALEARWLLGQQRVELAHQQAERALKAGEWCDTARFVLALSNAALGKPKAALTILQPIVDRIRQNKPPEYFYRPQSGTWELVHDLPAIIRQERLIQTVIRRSAR